MYRCIVWFIVIVFVFLKQSCIRPGTPGAWPEAGPTAMNLQAVPGTMPYGQAAAPASWPFLGRSIALQVGIQAPALMPVAPAAAPAAPAGATASASAGIAAAVAAATAANKVTAAGLQ